MCELFEENLTSSCPQVVRTFVNAVIMSARVTNREPIIAKSMGVKMTTIVVCVKKIFNPVFPKDV